jgi:hypothetical protein
MMLERRFRLTMVPADWMAGLEAAEAVVQIDSAAPSIRILNTRAAASLAPASRPARAADLLEAAVLLLPEVAPRQLERSDQQDALGGLAGLANDAAARALASTSMPASQRAARALGLLEAGRSVLLSQALSTRSDLTDLRARDPGLARRFSSLCDLLDQGSGTRSGPAGLYGHQLASPAVAGDRQRLAAELATVVSEIRALDGLASFGMPPMREELLTQAAAGPVVTFGPVLEALGYRDRPREDMPWRRVWWAPGGHLGQLPLHAAGHYVGQLSGDHAGRNVMDRVISSYTPTVRALGYAREQAASARTGKPLIVAVP